MNSVSLTNLTSDTCSGMDTEVVTLSGLGVNPSCAPHAPLMRPHAPLMRPSCAPFAHGREPMVCLREATWESPSQVCACLLNQQGIRSCRSSCRSFICRGLPRASPKIINLQSSHQINLLLPGQDIYPYYNNNGLNDASQCNLDSCAEHGEWTGLNELLASFNLDPKLVWQEG